MTIAICFRCGREKSGALVKCGDCVATPRTSDEIATALALSRHLSSESDLAVFARQIKQHGRAVVPDALLAQARQALDDKQLLAMLGGSRAPPQAAAAPVSRNSEGGVVQRQPETSAAPAVQQGVRQLRETALHRNPFWVLGATPRDDRRHIVELADQKLLEIDHEVCQKARSDLTNPRTRLAAEMAWLPGLSPNKAAQLARQILQDAMSARDELVGPPLAHANLMAAALEAIKEDDDPADVAEFIQDLAWMADEVDVDDVLRDINEDRAVSGFPEIRSTEQVQSELTERRRYFRDAVRSALDRLPPASLIAAITTAVIEATLDGQHHAPQLIETIVDSYEVGAKDFLQREADNAQRLIAAIRAAANSGEDKIKPLIDRLEIVSRNWDRVAQPIQVCAQARGVRHEPSMQFGFAIRSLAVDLFNGHQMLAQSRRLTALLQELFSELPELTEQVGQDADTLKEIAQDLAEAESARREWERQIIYSAEVGAVFKSTLSISPKGISWQGRNFPLETITRVRWGGISRSVNGIPTGTSYTLAFGDVHSEAVVTLRRQEIFSTFVDKLWRAVGIRLLTEFLQSLKSGKEVRLGPVAISDDRVTLPRNRFWGSSEHVPCAWSQVQVWTADGSFCIGAKDDKKVGAQLSYIEVPNVHIVEQAIRMAFNQPETRFLSDLLAKDK